MILILKAITKTPDLIINFIEVELQSGKTISLNWNESSVERIKDGFIAWYEGVCFDEDHADGKLDDLQNMQIVDIGLYSESKAISDITIEEMLFEECEKSMCFTAPLFTAEAWDSNG